MLILMGLEPAIYWLIGGLFLLAFEFFIAPSIGFLFLSIGALANAAVIQINPKFYTYQFISFTAFSVLAFFIFWRAYFRIRQNEVPNLDIIGNTAIVYQTLEPGKIGEVKWSGAIMNAKLEESEKHIAHKDEAVKVMAIQGNILICTKVNL